MTPEDLAKKLIPGCRDRRCPACDRTRWEIVDAIRAAVEEEREACAQLADDFDGGPQYGEDIAAAIRARGAL